MLGESFGEPAENGTQLTVKLTHQQLASMVGTTRETMNRMLIEFWDAKLIDMPARTSLFLTRSVWQLCELSSLSRDIPEGRL
jgi:CRP-like cAMP-binding protein